MSEQSNKLPLGTFFRLKREEKGLLIRQVAAVTELDQAIISRIENCDRLPTKEQLMKFAGLYNLDQKEIMATWLAEKMVWDYGHEPLAREALLEANQIMYSRNLAAESPDEFPSHSNSTKRKPTKPKPGTNQKTNNPQSSKNED